jgi:hypothetical protein
MDLAHVRWIGGGTGAGKSTVARILSARTGAVVYDGDRAEHDWVSRCTQRDHPHMHANLLRSREERALLSPAEKVAGMASRHGETIGFVVDDLRAMPGRLAIVDWFGNLPRDVAPLLSWPEQAAFLLPTREFRRHALSARFADPDRAKANWGTADTEVALANRLARDELLAAETREQATELGLPIVEIDGSRDAESVADELAELFRLKSV